MRDFVVILAIVVSLTSLSARAQTVSKGCCVAAAIDESTSLTDDQFEVTTKFVADLINDFERYGVPNGETAAVCTFSTRVTEVFRLSTHGTNKAAAVRAVRDLLLGGGLTYTHLAINKLGEFLSECASDYNKAGLIITDGNASFLDLTKAAAANFKGSGYILIVVGIGSNINHDDLRNIASPKFYYPVADFASLESISDTIQTVLCSEVKTTTTPTTTTTTPTTTTTTPTTTTTTTTQPPIRTGSCLECEFINGLYLFRNRRNCYVFNQCLSYTQAVPFERPCPFGQFFEPKSATCKPANKVDCPDDPCKNSNVQSYPNHRVCSAYFTCANGRTDTEMCCAAGERFVRGRGCVTDATCTQICNPVPVDPPCLSRPDPNDATKYQENVVTGVWISRDCAPGTNFDTVTCRCSVAVTVQPDPACDHELYLPFNANDQDYMYRRYVTNDAPKVEIESVTGAVGGKAAQFGGSSRLLVKSYDNAWFGQELVIRTRFQESTTSRPPAGTLESLFGNGDCTRKGSIEVNYDRANNRVNARLVTYDKDMNEVVTTTSVSSVSPGDWKDVEFRYDGSTLTLTVDGVANTAAASGNVATRQAALQIGGGCLNNEYLHGWEDEFYVYPCLP